MLHFWRYDGDMNLRGDRGSWDRLLVRMTAASDYTTHSRRSSARSYLSPKDLNMPKLTPVAVSPVEEVVADIPIKKIPVSNAKRPSRRPLCRADHSHPGLGCLAVRDEVG